MELKNQFISTKFKTYGGELTSLKSNEDALEYLWIGDKKYWPGQAPTLFPIVGKVKSGIMNQHGIARKMEHSVLNKSDNSISFELIYNDDTLKVYPYKFKLITTYTIENKTIYIKYTVKNLDTTNIYFSIGAHPGFNIPLSTKETFEDYYVEFNEKENAPIYPIDMSTGFIMSTPKKFLENANIIKLNHDLFKNDALVFKGLKSNSISIKSIKSTKGVTMNFEGFPWFGIWSKPTGAPFVCLEPWFGHSDFSNFDGEFHEKDAIQKLEVNGEFSCSFSITVF